MGAYYGWKTREAVIADVLRCGVGWRTAESRVAEEDGKTCVWAIREQTGPVYDDAAPRSYITLDVVDEAGGSWGHKPMDEGVGPFYYSCPAAWLDRVPQAEGPFAGAWRAKVRARAEEKRRRVPEFDPADCGGAFDGFSVTSDADPGL